MVDLLTPPQAGLTAAKRALLEARLKGVYRQEATVRRTHRTEAPASFAQERFWFIDRLAPGSTAYNVFHGQRLSGGLDEAALERALGELVRRHEVLRTTFREEEGVPVQVVAPFAGYTLAVDDLSGMDEEAREAEVRRLADLEAAHTFDLAAGPLFRARLLRLGGEEHALLLCLHHIVTDGWSQRVLHGDLWKLYDAFREGRPSPLPELPAQYVDFALWQREQAGGEAGARHLAYWKSQLAGVQGVLDLPTDFPRPAVPSHRGGRVLVEVSPERTERLREVGRSEGATPFMVMLAAFNTVLAWYSGSDDVLVGSPIAGRKYRELEEVVGLFVNTLALRTDLSGDPTLRGLVGRVRDVMLGAYEHQDTPLDRIVAEVRPERSLSHGTLFQVAFQLLEHTETEAGERAQGMQARSLGGARGESKMDLTLGVYSHPGGMTAGLTYSTDLFEHATIERMGRHLDRVLRQLADDPDRRLSELDLLDDEERRLILHAWNAPAREVEAACIHPLFAAQAARTPDAEAVRFAGRGMTYRELDEASSRLAHHLAARGVRPESRVGVLAERAPETVVGILAVLKAGGAYVPLDPAYPAERLRYMLADCGAHTVLAPAGVPEELAGLIPDVLDLRAEQDAIRRHPAAAPPVPAHPDGVAYVIYTSGSTGLPKGVMVAHRGVPNLARMHRDRYGVGPGTRVLQFASFSFDAAVWEMFPTLLSGATLVLASRDDLLPGPGLVETLRSERVSLVTLPPPVLAVLPADELPELRTVVSAGEALDAAIVDRWSAGRTLVNAYGPTETTVCATFGICQADGRTPPIGRAFDNVHVHVLEGAGRLSPVGVPGELCVGGVGVARGYLNRPALTAERFVPDPFGAPGSRMYRTGDRARWRPSGTLEFMGRADGQVKVNGFRVEPGEVEAVLRRYPGVRECAVVARQEARGGRRLVGYVVPEPDAGAPFPAEGSALAAALRAHLLQHLPAHMVPGAFVRLDALPMTPNGKLDRAALPAPEPGRAHLQEDEPRNFVEVQLIQLWEEVLGVRNVGATQSFFEVGGSSLLALPLLAKMNRIPGCDVSVSTLFAGATVRQLADAVLDGRSDAPRPASPVVPLQPNGSLPPLFVIHPAGRSVSGYVHLVRHLGADQPVYGVEDRGEDLARPIEQIAAEHLRAIRSVQPRGPYALAGWSFGGYVAYEMAVQLERGGEQAAFVGLLDAISPRWAQAWAGSSLASSPFRMARGVAWQMRVDFPVEEAEVEGLHPDEQIRFLVGVLHAQGVDPAGFGEETLRVMCGMMEDRRTSVDRYAPGRFHGTLTVFRASIAPSQEQWEAVASTDEERRTQGWSVLAGGPVEVHRVPGSHNSMGAEPHVRVLAQLVREEMAAGHARTAAAAA